MSLWVLVCAPVVPAVNLRRRKSYLSRFSVIELRRKSPRRKPYHLQWSDWHSTTHAMLSLVLLACSFDSNGMKYKAEQKNPHTTLTSNRGAMAAIRHESAPSLLQATDRFPAACKLLDVFINTAYSINLLRAVVAYIAGRVRKTLRTKNKSCGEHE